MIYAMSDIHGQYDKYKRMLDIIKFSDQDHLYIIGDSIDRGPEGGPLLMDILTDSNVTLLMGNHELMMLHSCRSSYDRELWFRNGAQTTIDGLMDMNINFNDLLPEVKKCPLIIPRLEVDGCQYYLVHAYAPPKQYTHDVYLEDVSDEEANDIVWARDWSYHTPYSTHNSVFQFFPDATILIGHTPIYRCAYGYVTEDGMPLISSTANGHILNLDCGCAKNLCLGCMNLNTKETYYVT